LYSRSAIKSEDTEALMSWSLLLLIMLVKRKIWLTGQRQQWLTEPGCPTR